MKQMGQDEMDAWTATALEGAKALREFFKYQGSNPVFEKKARSAGSMIGAYSRMRGTEANLVTGAAKIAKLSDAQRKIAKDQLEGKIR